MIREEQLMDEKSALMYNLQNEMGRREVGYVD